MTWPDPTQYFRSGQTNYPTQPDPFRALINSNDIKKILPLVPEPVKIDEADKHFQYCITDIKRKMGIIGSAKSSNEAVRCSYIEAILLSAMYIVKDITRKRISLEPQFEVVGEEATGRVDYAIKKIIDSLNEELICITEGKQNQEVLGIMQNIMQLESSYHTNKRKRKASEAFDDDFDYLYGIVTTGEIFWPQLRNIWWANVGWYY